MLPLLKISDSIAIPTYFVFLSLLYSFLIFYSYRRSVKQGISSELTLNLSLVIMLSGFVGARLFHIIYEDFAFYQENWLRIFMFWYGGFVYYGGVIAGFAAAVIYLKWQRQPLTPWLDFFAPVMALGYGLGRASCLLAGCCYGKLCALPWSISGRHPTQLYAMIYELVVFSILILMERTKKKNIFLTWMILHSVGRLIMEHYRDDFRGDFYQGLSISSWISLIVLSLALGALATQKTRQRSS